MSNSTNGDNKNGTLKETFLKGEIRTKHTKKKLIQIKKIRKKHTETKKNKKKLIQIKKIGPTLTKRYQYKW
jgi:hypothetical protein